MNRPWMSVYMVRKAGQPLSSLCGLNGNSLIGSLPNHSLGEISRGAHSTHSEIGPLIRTSLPWWAVVFRLLFSHTRPPSRLALLAPPAPAGSRGEQEYCSVTAWSFLKWMGQKEGASVPLPLSTPRRTWCSVPNEAFMGAGGLYNWVTLQFILHVHIKHCYVHKITVRVKETTMLSIDINYCF